MADAWVVSKDKIDKNRRVPKLAYRNLKVGKIVWVAISDAEGRRLTSRNDVREIATDAGGCTEKRDVGEEGDDSMTVSYDPPEQWNPIIPLATIAIDLNEY